ADGVPGELRVNALGGAGQLRDRARRRNGGDLYRLRDSQLERIVPGRVSDNPLKELEDINEFLVVGGLRVSDAHQGQTLLYPEQAHADPAVSAEDFPLLGVLNIAERCPDQESGHEPGGVRRLVVHEPAVPDELRQVDVTQVAVLERLERDLAARVGGVDLPDL